MTAKPVKKRYKRRAPAPSKPQAARKVSVEDASSRFLWLNWLATYKKYLLIVSLCLFFIGLIGLISQYSAQWFPIRHVKIQGNQKVQNTQLQAQLAPYLTAGMFQLNLTALRQTLLALVWIKTVKIERQWPDRLHIQLSEYQPVARWDADTLVDVSGALFPKPAEVEITQLPQLLGQTEHAQILLKRYNSWQSLLTPFGLHIQTLGYHAQHTWFMVLDHNIHLTLGRESHSSRLKRFLKVYQHLTMQYSQQLQQNKQLYADLRYTSGVAVRLAEAE